MTTAPLHHLEVRISLGGNTREYVIEALEEILETFKAGNISNSCSGGWNGSYSVTSSLRDITPDAYREELETWRRNQ